MHQWYSLERYAGDTFLHHLLFMRLCIMQAEVDKHIQGLYGYTRPQQMLFAESAGQLRLEAAAAGNGHMDAAQARGASALPRTGLGPGQPAVGGLAARLTPANGIAQPSVAQQLVSRYAEAPGLTSSAACRQQA